MNLEIQILTARAALPRAERGTSVAFITGYLAGRTLNLRGGVQGVFHSVNATAHGLVVSVTTVSGQAATGLLAEAEVA